MAADPPENDYESALSRWFPQPAEPGPAADKGVGFGLAKKSPVQAAALEQVRAWVKQRFSLADGDAILVSEIACTLPGCPPLETVVAFWTGDRRHHFKLFKRVVEVVFDDLPYAWLKNTLMVPEGFECECC